MDGIYNKEISLLVKKYYKFAVTTKRSRFDKSKFSLLEIPRSILMSPNNSFEFRKTLDERTSSIETILYPARQSDSWKDL